MSRLLRTAVALAAMIAATGALAGEAYYAVPLGDLNFTQGALPDGEAQPAPGVEPLRQFMEPYAVLDGAGEAYITQAEPRHLLIRAPEGKDLSGRLFFPKPDRTGMVILKFTASPRKASEDARELFYHAKQAHYERLLAAGIPGGAWFRLQARQAGGVVGGGRGRQTSVPALRGRSTTDQMQQTYSLLAGGKAMSENLQLGVALAGVGPEAGAATVNIANLPGIGVRPFDWTAMNRGLRPKLDPLAPLVPADQHAVFFPSVAAAIAVADRMSEHGTFFLKVLEPRSEDARLRERYERQFCLSLNNLASLLTPEIARSVAVTGSDPYVDMGTDLAILIESPRPRALFAVLLSQVHLEARKTPGARAVAGRMQGVFYRGVRTEDRSVCCYVAQLDRAVAVANSLYQLERLAEVCGDRSASLAGAPEYTFFRNRYPLGDAKEAALVILSDATIRRWCSPQWRIGDSRRVRAAGAMADRRAQWIEAWAARAFKAWPHTPAPADRAADHAGDLPSAYGTLDFMTPIAELPLTGVTPAEAQAYAHWRSQYEAQWTRFDPIAMRLELAPERLSADVTVMPLVLRTEYQNLIEITRGACIRPDAGDPHDAMLHAIFAVNKGHPYLQFGIMMLANSMPRRAGDPLGWFGQSVAVYVDDDPWFDELAKMPADQRQEVVRKPEGFFSFLLRAPVAIEAEVTDGPKLTLFLAALRAQVEEAAPGMVRWEVRKHHGEEYAKVTLTERGAAGRKDLEGAALYYAASGKALVASPNENVLQRALERQAAQRKPAGQGQPTQPANKPRPTPLVGPRPAQPAESPWLGQSVGVQVRQGLWERAEQLAGDHYQAMMQAKAWGNLPILNEWKRLYPDQDPVEVHERLWGTRLICPGGGRYVWTETWQTMESTVYGHPGAPKKGPTLPQGLAALRGADFGLTFEDRGLRARVALEMKPPKAPAAAPQAPAAAKPTAEKPPSSPPKEADWAATLRTNPTDAQVNFVTGKSLCFERGDWESGLPMLALGGDQKLAALAERELRPPASPADKLQLADDWWSLAETATGVERKGMLLRAGAWYGEVRGDTSPPSRAGEIEERYNQIVALGGTLPDLPATEEYEPWPAPGRQSGAERPFPQQPTPLEKLPLAQWKELLDRVDCRRDSVEGHWARVGRNILVKSGDHARLMLPIAADGDYDLEVEFTRTQGENTVLTFYPVGDRTCAVTFDRPEALANGQRYKLRISVRGVPDAPGIDFWLDGKHSIHLAQRPASIERWSTWSLPETRRPGLGTSANQVTFHSVRFRRTSGDATWVRGAWLAGR